MSKPYIPNDLLDEVPEVAGYVDAWVYRMIAAFEVGRKSVAKEIQKRTEEIIDA